MIQFENKFEKGQKVFMVLQRKESPNILEVRPTNIVGVLYEDLPGDGVPTISLLHQFEINPAKEVYRSPIGHFFGTKQEAVDALPIRASEIREEGDREIEKMKHQIQSIKDIKDNIQQVVPDEIVYEPKK